MILRRRKGRSAPQLRMVLTCPPENRVWREVWRLCWFTLAIHLLVSLVTYSSNDPSWTTWNSHSNYQNWMGRVGSIEADILFQLLGLGAYSIAVLFCLIGLRGSHQDAPLPTWISRLAPVAFLAALSSVLEATVPSGFSTQALTHPGGVIGHLMYTGLNYLSGPVGAIAIGWVLLVATLILLVDRPLLSHLWNLLLTIGTKGVPLLKKGYSATRSKLTRWKRNIPNLPLLPSKCPERPVSEPQIAWSPSPTANEEPAPPEKPMRQGVFPLLSIREPEKKKIFSSPRRNRPVDRDFELPPNSLLTKSPPNPSSHLDKQWFVEKSDILLQKLNDFGVEGEIVNICPGPVITVYEFKPASGVKIKEIANLSDDLTLALSVLSVRIVAPIPGKPVVGIEIPSPQRQTVLFRELLEETPFYEPKVKIPLLLGRLASGEPVLADLSSMPHLLVAGATGTGKSVFINSLITSLLMRFTPKELRLILVDPKMVELSHYDEIPHLLLPVVVDSKKASHALRWTVAEMERRYSLLHKAGVRHIDAYNTKLDKLHGTEDQFMVENENGEEVPAENLPFIVVVIDEYADLMSVVPKEVENSIARLAQKARASGIHIVLATQRPSTDVVTGLIKANFPSRLSFRVASAVDSKTILDRTGAERLLGNGDLLLHSAGFSMLKRMQGAYISDADTEKVVEFLKSQGEPEYDEKIMETVESGEDVAEGSEKDENLGKLYDDAVRLVADRGEASISLIQRHLRIGYNRAANLMDVMEREGVVAPASGSSKRRQVLINQV